MDLTTAPWWGIPVIAGSFLLIGAIVSFLSVKASDSRKARRENRIRWHDEVRKLSAQAVSAARAVQKEAQNQTRMERFPPPDSELVDDSEFKAFRQRSEEAHEVLTQIRSDLVLVAPNRVIVQLIELEERSYATRYSSGNELEDETTKLKDQTVEFIAAVRRYLGTNDEERSIRFR